MLPYLFGDGDEGGVSGAGARVSAGVSTWKHLSVSHLRAVLGLVLDQQRKLLTLIEVKALMTEDLEGRVGGLRKPDGSRAGLEPGRRSRWRELS